jgi:hypothetical protein
MRLDCAREDRVSRMRSIFMEAMPATLSVVEAANGGAKRSVNELLSGAADQSEDDGSRPNSKRARGDP